MKTLLHIGVNVNTESLPKYFKQACDYDEIPLNKYTKDNLLNVSYVPDIIFLQIQSDTIDGKDTCSFIGQEIKTLRDKGSFIINWTGDLRKETPRWMIQFAKYVNITMFSNERDIEYCKSIGVNSGFLQCGIDTNIFKPDGVKADVPEIVFLANNYGNQFPLSKYRKDVVETLRLKYGNRFRVYGNGWGGNSGNVNSSQYEEAKVYRGCKVAISVSHFNSERYFSDRLGRALCTGAFVLSHNYKGIEKDFEIGTHLATFNDINDLFKSVEFWLEEHDTRNGISREGQKLASKEFSYQNMVKQILELT